MMALQERTNIHQLQYQELHRPFFIGTVSPISWDSCDLPIRFSLYMANDEEFLLQSPRGKDYLKKYINKKVVIYGDLIKSHNFDEYILICYEIHDYPRLVESKK